MQGEIPQQDIVAESQTFFWELYREMAGGPLDDELQTAARILDVNRHLHGLTQNGYINEVGAREITYEALVEADSVSVEGVEAITETQNDRSMKCTLQYLEDGFSIEGIEEPVQWMAKFELEGLDHTTIFSTIGGQIGKEEVPGIFTTETEYSRGLIVTANNFGMIFHPTIFISQTV